MSPTRARGKVRLVSTWWCMQCEDKGEAGMTQEAAARDAMKHMADKPRHTTVTNTRPAPR